MSTLHFLGAVDFEIPAEALPAVGPNLLLDWLQPDPFALSAARPIIQALCSAQYEVSEPEREGKGSVWFRCKMETHDAGIAVAIRDRRGNTLSVSTFACQMKKPGQLEIDPAVDPRWFDVSATIKFAIREHFGNQPGFVWLKEESYDSPSSRE